MYAESSTINQIQENMAGQNIRHLILEGAGVDELALSKSIPNQIIRTRDMSAWKEIQAKGMPSDFYQMLAYWSGLRQETSGVTPITMAMKAASTATGTSAMQANSQMMFDLTALVASLTWTAPMMRQLFSLTQQFMDMSVLINIPEKDLSQYQIPVSRHQIQGVFHVEPFDLRAYGRKLQRAQQAQAILAQAVQLKMPGNYEWLFEQIFTDLELYEPDQFFKGKMWSPMQEEAKARAAASAPPQQPIGGPPEVPPGIPGQPNANDVQGALPAPDSQRVALRMGPAGTMPENLQGLLGGGEPQ